MPAMASSKGMSGETGFRKTDGSIQLVSFRLGAEEYGIEIGKVREIILVGGITQVPRTPNYVKGLINLRSSVIPIIDLKLRFGMSESVRTEETRIIVVSVSQRTIGIVVDSVNEVLRVPTENIAPPPLSVAGLGHDYLTGIAKINERLLILLDITKILDFETNDVPAAIEQLA